MFFVQQLGGAVFTSVGQTLLDNLLASRLANIPGVNTADIVSTGATELASLLPPGDIPLIADAYNYACTRVFLTGMGLAVLALFSAFFLEWKSIKKGRHVPPGSPGSQGVMGGPEGPQGGGPPAPGLVAGVKSPAPEVAQVENRKREVSPKIVKAQKEAEERLRRARRESDPTYRRDLLRLAKKSNRFSVG